MFFFFRWVITVLNAWLLCKWCRLYAERIGREIDFSQGIRM
jgi:hypothetical protein